MSLKIWIVNVFNVDQNNQKVPKYNKKVKLRVDYDPEGISIRILDVDEFNQLLEFPVDSSTECCRVGSCSYIFTINNDILLVKFSNKEEARLFSVVMTKVKSGKDASVFSIRTEDSSATQYFQFYGYLFQQRDMMLQDFVKNNTYQRAILCNLDDFKDKIVLDVGAGSGILSFFAVQAGAKRVYAVEASTMAHYAQKLVDANNVSNSIKIITGKIEEIELPEKVDVIISEPMGYMLYDERMLESYLNAKKWLVPGGKMYPSRGDLHIAPFTDEDLYMERYSEAYFWFETYFCGVNLSPLQNCAVKENFRQPIIDTFDVRICMSKSMRHVVNFLEADETHLQTIDIPLEFIILRSGTCHGLAFWFDVAFTGSQQTIWLSTAPTEPLTHWLQVRCLLEQPLLLKQGQVLTGRVVLLANKRQSYDVTIELNVEGTTQTSKNTLDLKTTIIGILVLLYNHLEAKPIDDENQDGGR